MNRKEIYLSFILFSIAFVILLITLFPYRPSIGTSKYQCLDYEYLNCMPGPTMPKIECQPKYIDWAKANCPNFKGVVY